MESIEEIWKEVSNFPGYYISNIGRLRLLAGNISKTNPRSDGYIRTALKRGSISIQRFIQNLVATEFIPNPDNKKYVDHINGIRSDNRVENLRWVTAKENSNNKITTGQKRGRKVIQY